MTSLLTPAEMAAATDVSVDTLRYYEREGLLARIGRTDGGQRRYSSDDVAWVQVLRCFRTTAMPIRTMREFARLVSIGDGARGERLAFLQHHRNDIVGQIEDLQRALRTIDAKITAYSEDTSAQHHPVVKAVV
jgi:MerR family transcriptional regulator, aldehyde-responsive regulator